MAFDSMQFRLNYPLGSTQVVTNSSVGYKPAPAGLIKITLYDDTFLGAEADAYVLTSYGSKRVAELTSYDYISFFNPSTIYGQFKETVQFQATRDFLVNYVGVGKRVKSVSSLTEGYGLPNPIYLNESNGGLVGEDYPCVCVLFSDSCGTRMTTTISTIEQLES